MTDRQSNQHNLEQIKQLCSDAGIKLTHQRLEIFKELLSCTDHPSAELVHKWLQTRMPTIAIDTVYRTLATFDQLGVVKKLHIANERTLFDTNLDVHHHFFCTKCKQVEDVYWPDFDDTDLPQTVHGMGKVQFRYLELQGICSSCMAEKV
jgi:Fur family peroxide stress response transcriptional regulator